MSSHFAIKNRGKLFICNKEIPYLKKVNAYLTTEDTEGYDGFIEFEVVDSTDLLLQDIIINTYKGKEIPIKIHYELKNDKCLNIKGCKWLKKNNKISLINLDADKREASCNKYILKFKSSNVFID